MNEDIATRWRGRLDSGLYKQGKEYLKANGKNGVMRLCCLGVLCEMFAEETGRGVWRGHEFVVDGDYSETGLPLAVREWAGMKSSSGVFVEVNGKKKTGMSLAELNDNGVQFWKISQIIGEHVAEL